MTNQASFRLEVKGLFWLRWKVRALGWLIKGANWILGKPAKRINVALRMPDVKVVES